MERDRAPSKQFNSKLSLDTHKKIETLIKEHGYATQRQVIESAVESLFNSVAPSEAEEVSEVKPTFGSARGLITMSDDFEEPDDGKLGGRPFSDGSGVTGTAKQTGANTFKVTPRSSGFTRTIRQKGDGKR